MKLHRYFLFSSFRSSALFAVGAVAGSSLSALTLLMPTSSSAQDGAKPAAEEKPAAAAAEGAGDAAASEKELLERLSYAYGIVMSRQLKDQGVELNLDKFVEAYKASVSGGEVAMTDDDLRNTFQEHAAMMSAKETAAGDAFLKDNAARDGVSVTDSGLQYEVLEKGDGAKPKATDKVKVHYEGTLIDGTKFDSSYDRGEPIEFALNRVIPGWTEGVQLMPIGSKFRFVIPYDLAYGEQGSPPAIPPKATLVFIVELLGVVQ
jgi:FKBP-type peptidyl-prolyl cis-trans isomerase FklB